MMKTAEQHNLPHIGKVEVENKPIIITSRIKTWRVQWQPKDASEWEDIEAEEWSAPELANLRLSWFEKRFAKVMNLRVDEGTL